jgi:hypothetical protein
MSIVQPIVAKNIIKNGKIEFTNGLSEIYLLNFQIGNSEEIKKISSLAEKAIDH